MKSRNLGASFRQGGGGLSRRDFLSWQLKGALFLACGGAFPPRPVLAEAYPDVAVVTGPPAGAVKAAVDLLGGMGRFVKPGNRVVIKPNFSFANPPEAATTTNPEVVRELLVLCKEAGAASVLILDNPLNVAELCLEQSAVRSACDGVERGAVQALDDARFYRAADIPQGASFKKTEVMADVLDADVLISAPVAKSHSGAGVSLSMKNLMGLIWNRGVMHSRHDLHEAIVDLASLLHPALCVIDAIRTLSTNGPGGPGKVIKMDTVIASPDMVAADAEAVTLCEWYGKHFEPRQVKHIALAHKRGLGRMDVENLDVRRVSL